MNQLNRERVKQRGLVFFGAILIGMSLFSNVRAGEELGQVRAIEVLEDSTWVKKEQVEKTKIYNNGIKETIIINKATGHISIDMRPVKAKSKPKKKAKPNKKTKVDKKEISAANFALQRKGTGPHARTDAIERDNPMNKKKRAGVSASTQVKEASNLAKAHSKIKSVANNRDLIHEMINALRKHNPKISSINGGVAATEASPLVTTLRPVTKIDSLPTPKNTQQAGMLGDSVDFEGIAKKIDRKSAMDLSLEVRKLTRVPMKANVDSKLFNLSKSKLTRKIEKRKRLVRQKIQADYEASKEQHFAKTQKYLTTQRSKRYKDIAYTCRSEGKRIKMAMNFKAPGAAQVCELLYFKSNSYKPIHIGDFQSRQCESQAKRWLKKQKAWGWQCDSV